MNYWRRSLHEVYRQKIDQQTFCFQKFVDNAQQCFAFTPQANFPAHNLNFHWRWRWWDRIQAIFLNLFYFKNLYFDGRATLCSKSEVILTKVFRRWWKMQIGRSIRYGCKRPNFLLRCDGPYTCQTKEIKGPILLLMPMQ